MKYIVTRNNPYYPEVEYVESLYEAEKIRSEWLEDLGELDGQYENLITIAEVIHNTKFKSCY